MMWTLRPTQAILKWHQLLTVMVMISKSNHPVTWKPRLPHLICGNMTQVSEAWLPCVLCIHVTDVFGIKNYYLHNIIYLCMPSYTYCSTCIHRFYKQFVTHQRTATLTNLRVHLGLRHMVYGSYSYLCLEEYATPIFKVQVNLHWRWMHYNSPNVWKHLSEYLLV
jgi:hypothetical protein